MPKCAYVFGWLHLVKFRANCYTIDWALEWSKNVRGQNKQTVSQSGYSLHTDKARNSVNKNSSTTMREHRHLLSVFFTTPRTEAPKTLPAKTLLFQRSTWDLKRNVNSIHKPTITQETEERGRNILILKSSRRYKVNSTPIPPLTPHTHTHTFTHPIMSHLNGRLKQKAVGKISRKYFKWEMKIRGENVIHSIL